MLFNIFINDLDDGVESSLTKFAGATSWVVEMDMSEGRTVSHRDLAGLQE